MKYFSPSTKGFYGLEHQENKPNDCVEITDDEYNKVQSYDAILYELSSDINGKPILVNKIDNRTYDEKRKIEYPHFGEQLDMLWHAIDNENLNKTSEFYNVLKSIKSKYPKGT